MKLLTRTDVLVGIVSVDVVHVDLAGVGVEVHIRHVAIGVPFFVWAHPFHQKSFSKFSVFAGSYRNFPRGGPHQAQTSSFVSIRQTAIHMEPVY